MNKRRKPLTQLLATVSKSFTSLESAIDVKSVTTIPYKLQQARNKYAAKKIAEQKRREEEARRKQMLENEKAQYRSDISVMLDTAYAAYVEKHINALNSMFNRATLATYNDVCRRISETSINFSWSAFVENVSDNKQTFYMDAEERKRREEEAKAKAAAEKSAAEVQAAFDFSAASMSPTPTKAKVKKKIQITNPQGFMQVYQMWFMREGINMSMEDLEKVHKKMITYCEKVVNKDGEQIQSAYVKYIDDVTAK